MNVSLTPELERFVADEVESGRYTSASEVVHEALRRLKDKEKTRIAQLAEFNRELSRRLTALDSREHVDPQELRTRLVRRVAERRRAHG
jgi:antitoxin ParD1/3/4